MITVLKRPAAPSSGTRQNVRRELFAKAFFKLSRQYWREPRAARRKIARAQAKNHWKARVV